MPGVDKNTKDQRFCCRKAGWEESRIFMKNRNSPHTRMAAALAFIREHLNNPDLSPSGVANQVDLDLPVFCRAFKRATGLTCTDHIALQRIRVAKRLLTQQDLLVKEVAYRVGFENPNYFSRRFKEMEGRTPTSYRRLNHH
jgi:two-component system response regulator YesN